MSIENLMNMRLCPDCKVDVDMEVPNRCFTGTHKWHDPQGDSWDMCCECGLDVDVLYK
jgi:hypothetical protein